MTTCPVLGLGVSPQQSADAAGARDAIAESRASENGGQPKKAQAVRCTSDSVCNRAVQEGDEIHLAEVDPRTGKTCKYVMTATTVGEKNVFGFTHYFSGPVWSVSGDAAACENLMIQFSDSELVLYNVKKKGKK